MGHEAMWEQTSGLQLPGPPLPSFTLRKFWSLEVLEAFQMDSNGTQKSWWGVSQLLSAPATIAVGGRSYSVTTTFQSLSPPNGLRQGFLAFPADTRLGLGCERLREMACRKKVGVGTWLNG